MTSITYTVTFGNIIHRTTSSIEQTAVSIKNKSSRFLEEIKDRLHFLIEFFKDPIANGSIVPSPPQLTNKIVQFISKDSSKPNRYLEVGPGTGVFTRGIIERLKANDHLDVVELNPSFCEALKKKFIDHKNVHIHCTSITDWDPEYQYDAVVSGLPLNAFPPELVQSCLNVFKKVTKHDGTVSYFEYPNAANIWHKVLWGEKKKQFEQVLAIKNKFFETYGFKTEQVEECFPTATALHFKMNPSNDNNVA